ncbi:MAG: translation initiation factor IF-2 subunit gamma [Candidatus Aenigmatarchaeota archaeon]|nr:MAG: translation initiation factor IF-2 subunit gamma [Candidatus Aenigmarchaeota archaeon]
MDSRFVPEVNIGLVGHVDHGKTTLVEALTGKWTDTHSEEQKRGITIRLGYADVTFYKCSKDGQWCNGAKCPTCFGDAEPVRTVSFVDAPGHSTLMATVLSGASIMDGALLLVSASEKCPQPQTAEHLIALDIVGIRNVIIVQNKIDSVDEKRVRESYEEIKKFVKGTVAENAPVIPISALQRINIDALIETIQEKIATPSRDPKKEPKMYVARSFDINKPGTSYDKLNGGVLGGSIVQGILNVADEIEIRPGWEKGGKWMSLRTTVAGLQKVGKNVDEAGPGGLLGISTKLDPFLTKADSLAGHVVGLPGKLPPVHTKLLLDVHLLEKMVETSERVKPINTNEPLMMTCAVAKTAGVVTSARKEGREVEIVLKLPICADYGDRVAISRLHQNRWRLIGHGIIKRAT